MLGRALLRFPVRVRPSHLDVFQGHHSVACRGPAVNQLRSYATPGRPKSVVGEPSRPVKRAVKKAARRPADGESAAEQQIAASRRRSPKKKATKAKPQKTLTPEQKAANKEKAKAAAEKTKLAELRKHALTPPRNIATSGYHMFISEKMKEKDLSSGVDVTERRKRVGEAMRSISAEWKSASAGDIEHYNHLAVEKRRATDAEYKRWVESHTPEEILLANNARMQLRKKSAKDKTKGKASKWPKIVDERAVKRPLSSFAQFSLNRNASGDFKNIPLSQRSKLIGQEWRALNEEEKTKYRSMHEQEHVRYVSQYTDIYGRVPPNAVSIDKPEAIAVAA